MAVLPPVKGRETRERRPDAAAGRTTPPNTALPSADAPYSARTRGRRAQRREGLPRTTKTTPCARVSRAFVDTALVRYVRGEGYFDDTEFLTETIIKIRFGEPLSAGRFPKELYGKYAGGTVKRLTDLCYAMGLIVVSRAVADDLCQFDLGQGAPCPVKVFQIDRHPPSRENISASISATEKRVFGRSSHRGRNESFLTKTSGASLRQYGTTRSHSTLRPWSARTYGSKNHAFVTPSS